MVYNDNIIKAIAGTITVEHQKRVTPLQTGGSSKGKAQSNSYDLEFMTVLTSMISLCL